MKGILYTVSGTAATSKKENKKAKLLLKTPTEESLLNLIECPAEIDSVKLGLEEMVEADIPGVVVSGEKK